MICPKRAIITVFMLCVAFGCSKKPGGQNHIKDQAMETTRDETENPVAQSIETDASDAPDPYACQVDSDCITTCAHGALNKQWFKKNLPLIGDCLDGCQMGAEAPRCVSGACVSFRNGKPDDACTNKPLK